MFTALRILIALLALLFLLGGLLFVAVGGPPGLSGLWLMVLGAAGLIGVAFERTRYRSEAAERSGGQGSGAGTEDGPLDPRFRPTDERFVDPTTRLPVRVWTDPSTGERQNRRDE